MFIVALIMMLCLTATSGLAVIIGLFGVAKSLVQRDKTRAIQLTWLVIRIGLVLSGCITVLVTHGKSIVTAMILLMTFAVLQIVNWRFLHKSPF